MAGTTSHRLKLWLILAVLVVAGSVQAQSGYLNQEEFKPLIGRWKTQQAQFNSAAFNAEYSHFNSNWSGRMYGVVRENGEILFKADNGCVLSALASPFASRTFWSFVGDLEGCSPAHFNQRVFGTMKREGGFLVIEAAQLPMQVGLPPVNYKMKMVMVKY